MQINFEGHNANSFYFLRQFRRRMQADAFNNNRPTPSEPIPSASLTDLENSIQRDITLPSARKPVSSFTAIGALKRGEVFPSSALSQAILPSDHGVLASRYCARIYGARFVDDDGNRFITACQDRYIRVYENTKSDNPKDWKCTHEIYAQGVNWTITDFDVSPDGRWLAYSSINRVVHIADLVRKDEPHISLNIPKPYRVRVFIWSLKWSQDGRELIIGAVSRPPKPAGIMYIYDVESKRIVELIEGHDSDVNSVSYLQKNDPNLIITGSDDILVKMWDRRALRSRRQDEQYKACGVFVGHQHGITFVSSKNDGKFFISNGKDQMIKLWDARKCMSDSDISSVRSSTTNSSFDAQETNVETGNGYNDSSVITYTGSHETLHTLIRAYFSPLHTTGQKYIYCGSSEGHCVVYETTTGKHVKNIGQHSSPVRDVSWHPYSHYLSTGSWDGSVMVWPAHKKYDGSELEEKEDVAGEYDMSMLSD